MTHRSGRLAMGDAGDAAAGDRSGERLEAREAAPTRRGGRQRGGQGQGRGKRARSAPGAGGGRGQEPPPRALPTRKWMMYAPPRQEAAADAKDAPVVASTFRVLSFNVLAGRVFILDGGRLSRRDGSVDAWCRLHCAARLRERERQARGEIRVRRRSLRCEWTLWMRLTVAVAR